MTIFRTSFVLSRQWHASSMKGGLKIYLGYVQSLGQEYPLTEVGTSPAHNYGKIY